MQSESPAAPLWSLLRKLPASNLDRPAVVCATSGVKVTHREMQDLALRFAGTLTRDLGYVAGDKLGLVLGGNYVQSVIAQLSAAAAGITCVTATMPEAPVLEGCKGMVVCTNVLQGRPPQVSPTAQT
jgi:acyl-CoA synthetase (AMP-forming)/AMP-acid ligase II